MKNLQLHSKRRGHLLCMKIYRLESKVFNDTIISVISVKKIRVPDDTDFL